MSQIFDKPRFLATPGMIESDIAATSMDVVTTPIAIAAMAANLNKTMKTLVTIAWEHD